MSILELGEGGGGEVQATDALEQCPPGYYSYSNLLLLSMNCSLLLHPHVLETDSSMLLCTRSLTEWPLQNSSVALFIILVVIFMNIWNENVRWSFR